MGTLLVPSIKRRATLDAAAVGRGYGGGSASLCLSAAILFGSPARLHVSLRQTGIDWSISIFICLSIILVSEVPSICQRSASLARNVFFKGRLARGKFLA